jgi:hypothetical protein
MCLLINYAYICEFRDCKTANFIKVLWNNNLKKVAGLWDLTSSSPVHVYRRFSTGAIYLFCVSVSKLDDIASDGRTVDEMERIRKERVVTN